MEEIDADEEYIIEYDGIVINDFFIVCSIDLGIRFNNFGEYWNPAWVAECLTCGVKQIVNENDIKNETNFNCNHKGETK